MSVTGETTGTTATASHPERGRRRTRVLTEAAWAFSVGTVGLVLGMVALGISPGDLGKRWQSGMADDEMLHYMVGTAASDTFFFSTNPFLGFPGGQSLFFAPMYDPVSAAIMEFLSLFVRDGITLINVYHLLGFFLVSVASYAFIRSLRTRRITAAVFGLVLALAPFHFQRVGFGHAFVANYWAVPLVGILLLMVFSRSSNPFERWSEDAPTRKARVVRRLIPILSLTLAVSLSLSYYFVFALLILVGLLALRAIRILIEKSSWAPLLWPTVTVASLTAFVVIQLGILSLNFGERYSRYFSDRSSFESEYHGGKITSLIFPWTGSGFTPLARFSADYAAGTNVAATAEPTGTPLVALFGFGIVLLMVMLPLISRQGSSPGGPVLALLSDARLRALSFAFLWALLFFTVAGFGSLFAILVSPELRSWVRMSVVLIMLAIGALALVVDRLALRVSRLVPTLVLFAVIAAVDQLAGVSSAINLAPTADREYRQFFSEAEQLLDEDCGVVQLPLKRFPESGPIGQLEDYSEFLPYVLSSPTSTLRWSYGAVGGTYSGDYWADVSTPTDFADRVEESGACAILVDQLGYTDDVDGWKPYVDAVDDAGSPDLISSDDTQRYLLFELKENETR